MWLSVDIFITISRIWTLLGQKHTYKSICPLLNMCKTLNNINNFFKLIRHIKQNVFTSYVSLGRYLQITKGVTEKSIYMYLNITFIYQSNTINWMAMSSIKKWTTHTQMKVKQQRNTLSKKARVSSRFKVRLFNIS